jgi:hypothetical protein
MYRREEKKYKNSTSLTIKKHFVRFNLHFKQLKKTVYENEKHHHHVWGSRSHHAWAREHFYGFILYLFMVWLFSQIVKL